MVVRPNKNNDYVGRGTDRHAALLGLRKAGPKEDFKLEGWTLDVTSYPPNTTKMWFERELQGKVNELTSEPPKMQSRNPGEPFYAPPLGEV